MGSERVGRDVRSVVDERLPLALGALYVVLVGFILVDLGVTGRMSQPVAAAVFLLPEALAVGLCVRTAQDRRLPRRDRRPWAWIAAAVVLHAASAMLIGVADVVDGGRLLVTAGGVATRLAFICLLLKGLLSFGSTPLTRQGRVRLAMDAGTVVGGGLMVIWYFIVGPILAGAAIRDSSTGLTMPVYPMLDLVLLVGVGTVLLRGVTAAARRSVQLLLVGSVVYLVMDMFVTWWTLERPLVDMGPSALQTVLAAPPFLIAAAAAEQCRQAGAGAGERERPRPLKPFNALPYLALVCGFALMAVAAAQAGIHPWPGLVAGSMLMTAAVAVRQIGVMRENHALVVTDSLTGLANRVLLRERLHQATELAERTGRGMAVLQIDLNGFKQVNDTYGHEAGDQVLVAFARALNRSLRASDTAARLGGDEFAVVLQDVDGAGTAEAVAERILAAADQEDVVTGGRRLPIRASIGIALSSAEVTEPAELLHRADLAMYAAKRRQAQGWELYHDALTVDTEELTLREDLVDALAARQLHLQYQPIVSLATGDLIAVEALVRWHHPTRGLVPPTVFVPLAEQIGLIDRIGNWVLRTACEQVQHWHEMLPDDRRLHLSVNCSPLHVDRGTLAADVLEILEGTGFDPANLVLEITETTHLDEDTAIPQLTLLRSHGVRIALDDFGTGYSSLRYLARLPVDILKLDRFFVAELDGDPEGSAVAEAVIRLSQALHLDTVAEGIEEPAQATHLSRLGFHSGQGYHYARPLDADALEQLLTRQPAPEPATPLQP